VSTGNWTENVKSYEAFKDELHVRGAMVLRGERAIPPAKIRQRLVDICHIGHPGISAMKRTLRKSTWWLGMDREAEAKVKGCEGCNWTAKSSPPVPMSRTIMPSGPWQQLAMDFYSANALGVKLLVLVDLHSRFLTVRIMKETSAPLVCDQLEDICAGLGYPEGIKADNGPPFDSAFLKDWCEKRDIQLFHSTPYAPWENGSAEAQMKGIGHALQTAASENRPWKEALADHVIRYNYRPLASTNEKPIELLHSRRVKGLMPFNWSSKNEGVDAEAARDRDRVEKLKGARYANRKRGARDCSIEPGEKVYTQNMRRTGNQPRFGPETFTVTKRSRGALELESADGARYKRSAKHVRKAPTPANPSLFYPTGNTSPHRAAQVAFRTTTSGEEETVRPQRPQRKGKRPSRFAT
jgi:transposase InsO family protein